MRLRKTHSHLFDNKCEGLSQALDIATGEAIFKSRKLNRVMTLAFRAYCKKDVVCTEWYRKR